ncbi:hypothetical protein PWY87_16195 [Kribbella solani]|uniref:hypothetical protein n=1 Tax=Kribbella solani TaxID=236067 RepID=UPI0029B175B2|nr:hypothetical protein [Kribbella solani]MDX3003232.1 hypothetical protein [Kribbella solani]
MTESYRSSGTFAPAVKFADPAFDVVAEIIKQVPDGGQSLYDAVCRRTTSCVGRCTT